MAQRQTYGTYLQHLINTGVGLVAPCIHRQICFTQDCPTCGEETQNDCGYCSSCHFTDPTQDRRCYYDINRCRFISR